MGWLTLCLCDFVLCKFVVDVLMEGCNAHVAHALFHAVHRNVSCVHCVYLRQVK
jgi:hypothetical protein